MPKATGHASVTERILARPRGRFARLHIEPSLPIVTPAQVGPRSDGVANPCGRPSDLEDVFLPTMRDSASIGRRDPSPCPSPHGRGDLVGGPETGSDLEAATGGTTRRTPTPRLTASRPRPDAPRGVSTCLSDLEAARPRYRFDLAGPADDAGLRALLREVLLEGAVRVTAEREPSFFAADAALGDDVQTIVAREKADGPPVGFGSRATRTVWLGGEPVRTAYLSGLRIAPAHRGRAILGRAWSALRALHDADPVPFSLLSVTAENTRAARLLSLGRGDAARLTPLVDVVTLALVVHRGHRPTSRAPSGAADALRAELGPPRDLWPVGPLPLGLEAGDDVVIERGGRAVAALSLWDASAVRQTVVQGYPGALGRLRPLVNAAARLAGAAPLPDSGQRLRAAFVVRPVALDGRALNAALGEALGRARTRGLGFVLVGLDARDPALPLVRRRPHVAYRSTLYAATWLGGETPVLTRPVHAEIATF